MVDQTIQIGQGHSGAPDYWTALSPLTVTTRGPAGGLFSVAPPGVGLSSFDDAFVSWNGATFDRALRRIYFYLFSGHENYHDRGTYYYDLLTDTYACLTRPRNFGLADAVGDGTTGICTDGSPPDTHGYNNLVATPDGRIWMLSMGSVDTVAGNGVGAPRAWMQDPQGLSQSTPAPFGWEDLGLNTLAGSNDVGCSNYDPISDRLIYAKQQPGGGTQKSIATWNPSTLVRTEHTLASSSSFGTSGEDMASVVFHDGSANSIWMGKGNGTNGRPIAMLNMQNLLAGAGAFIIPTWTGAVQPVGKCAIHYNPTLQQLWTWRQGFNQLVVANRPPMAGPYVFDWFLVTLGGVTISPPSGTSQGAVNGTFGRNAQIEMPDGKFGGCIFNEVNERPHIWKFPDTPMVAS